MVRQIQYLMRFFFFISKQDRISCLYFFINSHFNLDFLSQNIEILRLFIESINNLQRLIKPSLPRVFTGCNSEDERSPDCPSKNSRIPLINENFNYLQKMNYKVLVNIFILFLKENDLCILNKALYKIDGSDFVSKKVAYVADIDYLFEQLIV